MVKSNPSLADLEKIIKIAARVVVLFGETYLPIFNRLHEEMEKMRDTQNKEKLAIKLAKEYADME